MKLIPLSQGQFAMVDDADFERVNAHKWYAQKTRQNFYAVRTFFNSNGKKIHQHLHQFLMPGVPRIDHIDGNRLNDQMGNLRPATVRQNAQGARQKRKGVSSRFRGVSWHKTIKKWQVSLTFNGKFVSLGYFTDEIEAAHAYDSAAVFYFGEYASPNFPVGEICIT